jgi:hypothetical protein
METVYPRAMAYRIKHGIDIVVGADGTAVLRFNGKSIQLEVGVGKVIVPGKICSEGAQQQPCLGIPLFMHDGDDSSLMLQGHAGHFVQNVQGRTLV